MTTTAVNQSEPFRLIRASAGTGKTYRLALRYIELIRGGASPETILATTFTRKAAGEIFGRILKLLALAVDDREKREEISQYIAGPPLTGQSCMAMLKSLVQAMHRVSISTIDSFFSRVLHTYRCELDIPENPRLIDERHPLAGQLRLDAIEAMLADEDLDMLLDLLRRRHHDQAFQSVTAALDEMVLFFYSLYREAPDSQVWSRFQPDEPYRPVLDSRVIANLQSAAVHLPAHKSWQKSFAEDLELVRAGNWERFVSRGLAQALIVGKDTFYKKPIPSGLQEAYLPVIDHVRAHFARRLAGQAEAVYQLLRRFDSHFKRLCREQGVLFFSDLADRLSGDLPVLETEQLADIYYRLDASVRHLLLDEFQDTSLRQWAVLEPFVSEILSVYEPDAATGRSFFCVGDEKQAIYSWRGGCPQLFDAVQKQVEITGHPQIDYLSDSYRSSQVVLDAVNTVFSNLVNGPACDFNSAAARRWQDGFQRHESKKDIPGYILLCETAACDQDDDTTDDDDDENPAAALSNRGGHEAQVAGHISRLHHQLPAGRIGVLVPTHKAVAIMAHELRRLGLLVSGEGGIILSDIPAVATVMSAMKLADHPDDQAAAFHIVNSPLGQMLGLNTMDEKKLHEQSRSIRCDIADLGYASLLAAWIERLAPACDRQAMIHLMQLVDLARQYEPIATLRPARFAEYVESVRVESPLASGIRVMTYHGSKGLEFDAVVLPALDSLLNNRLPEFLVDRPSAVQSIRSVFCNGKQEVRAMFPHLEKPAADQEEQIFYEDLCTLYVAMTRAKSALYLYIRPLKLNKDGKPGKPPLCFASILRGILAGGHNAGSGGPVLYEKGSPRWYSPQSRKQKADSETTKVEPCDKTDYSVIPQFTLDAGRSPARSWPVVTPSGRPVDGQVDLRQILTFTSSRGMIRGTVFHAWFEQLGRFTRPDDLPPVDRLIDLAGQFEPADDDGKRQDDVNTFVTLLSRPEVHQLLAADPADGLWIEKPFAVRDGDHLLQGRFDRVVIEQHEGGTTGARLIDFKTDAAHNDFDLARLTDKYKPQIMAYRRALSLILAVPESRITAALLFVPGGKIVMI